MAIKGKGRARGTRRGVAGAPRPHLVIPRKPLFQRRGVQITLLVVLVSGIAALVWYGLARQRNAERLAAQREEVSSFGTFVEEALRTTRVGQPILTQYLILPELDNAVSQLKSGGLNAKRLSELADQARNWSKQARDAADAIRNLQPDLADLKEGRNLMRRALELYAGLADSVVAATVLEGKPRRDLVASVENQLTAAAEVWDTGWGKVTTVKTRLDIPLEPAPLPQPGGLPGS